MPIPSLIHPVKITFEILDRDQTMFDPYAREPVGQAIRTGESPRTGNRVTINGQVTYYYSGARLDRAQFNREGVVEESIGYLVLRFVDMRRAGLVVYGTDGKFSSFVLKRGDRVLYLGDRTVDFYIVGFKDFAHYAKLNQTMLEVDFTDRGPTHQQGNL